MPSDSMHRYSQHIYSDTHDVVEFVREHMGDEALTCLVKMFSEVNSARVNEYLLRNAGIISEFVGKTKSQRPPFFRKITKTVKDIRLEDKLFFILCTIVSMERSRKMIDLRDNFRAAFTPGASYRNSAAEAVLAAISIGETMSSVNYPFDVFGNLGIEYDDEDEFDGE